MATIAVIAADRRQARSIFRYVDGMLTSVPALATEMVDANMDAIALRNRVVIEIHTASFRVTRGYTFAAVLGTRLPSGGMTPRPIQTWKFSGHCGLA